LRRRSQQSKQAAAVPSPGGARKGCLARAIGPGCPPPVRSPAGPCHPPARQPAPGDTQGNVSRQLAGAVVLGGGAAPAPPLTGSGRFCASSTRVPKKNAVPTWGAARCAPRPGRDAWLSYVPCSREGQVGTKSLLHRASFLVIKKIACVNEHRGPRRCSNSMYHVTSDVAISKQLPLFTQIRQGLEKK
jgi:hypothetical protein